MSPERGPRLHVFTLGDFALARRGRRLRFRGKLPRKPLELLKALVALGGRAIPEHRLGEMLWPRAEADAAQQALATTVHRLRRLLGDASCVDRGGGRLSLDPDRCWVDAWELERVLQEADRPRSGANHGEDAWEARQRAVDRAVALYRGPFLDGEDSSWRLPMADRLRRTLFRHLNAMCDHWEGAGQWERAIDCFLKLLELDEAAEEPARRLMRVYMRLGRHAEAHKVYARCRAMLGSVRLEPSRETESLHRLLRSS